MGLVGFCVDRGVLVTVAVAAACAVLVMVEVKGKCGKLEELVKCLAAMRTTETLVLVDRVTVQNDAKKKGELTVTLDLATLAEGKGARS